MSKDEDADYQPEAQVKVPVGYVQGLVDPKKYGLQNFSDATTDVDANPMGFSVRVTKSGSMTQDTFYDWCLHFIKHLPKSQGKGGEPHILFLNGHASRWNLAAIKLLMENNVFPFYLPSHTSVWAQPNDNGPNKRFHVCVEEAIKKLR